MRFRTKRGSTLVVAVVLLAFILLTGAALVQWALLNVQHTVNLRSDGQAYYTAKSVLDAALEKLATDNATRQSMDDALKGLAPGGAPLRTTVTLPADTLPGQNVSVEIVCEQTEYTDSAACYGKQFLKMTASAQQDAQSAAIARRFVIKRTPPGARGIIGYSGDGAERVSHSITGQSVLKGDIFLTNAADVTLQGGRLEGNLYVDATQQIYVNDVAMESGGTMVLRTTENVFLQDNKAIPAVYAQSGTARYSLLGAEGHAPWSATVPSGINAAPTAYGVLPAWQVNSAAVQAAMGPLDAQLGAQYTVREYHGEDGASHAMGGNAGVVITESGTLRDEDGDADILSQDFTVDTRGGVIDLYSETLTEVQGIVLTVLGGGEVNLFTGHASFTVAEGFTVNRADGADTIVNLIGQNPDGANLVAQNCAAQVNLLSVYGTVNLMAQDAETQMLSGAIYAKHLLLTNAGIDAAEASFGSVLTGGGSGGGEAVISCTKGQYLGAE